MWSLQSRSYFADLLLPKSFYIATFSNLSRLLYANQCSLPNINMCLGSEKRTSDFLSLFSLDLGIKIFLLSSISRQNNTKRRNNFNYFKLSFWLLVLYGDIQPERLFHRFLLFFLSSFARMSGDKSFSILDFVKSIKNYIESFLREFKT